MNFTQVLRKFIRWVMAFLKIIAVLGLLSLVLPRLITAIHSASRIFAVTESPPADVAIVFGAGLRWDGTPSPVLRDRVRTAVELFFAGKVKKLLLSGDNRFVDYNEPGAMRDYALALGMPEEHMVLDYAGRRTYDTCYRAKAIFGVTSAILVTQEFHLPRALYTCQMLGLDAVGVAADQRRYGVISRLIWNSRELFATLTAFWDLHIAHPLPVLGKYEPIQLD